MSRKKATKQQKFDYAERDMAHWETLAAMFSKHGFSYETILKNWPAYIMRRDLPRFLAHYEMFKNVIDVPGCIVDLGVFRGASFFTWTNLLETFCASDRHRKVFGFDHFEGLRADQFVEADGAENRDFGKVDSGFKATAEEIQTLVELHNADNLLPGNERCRLIEGDVMETLPKFLEDNPGLKISLLHFDMDLYKPTKFALELLYPLVSTGGVVCFDEYALVPWQGETSAVDEYFRSSGNPPVIRKFPFTPASCYFVK